GWNNLFGVISHSDPDSTCNATMGFACKIPSGFTAEWGRLASFPRGQPASDCGTLRALASWSTVGVEIRTLRRGRGARSNLFFCSLDFFGDLLVLRIEYKRLGPVDQRLGNVSKGLVGVADVIKYHGVFL